MTTPGRREPIRFPNAGKGTCRHCGRPCGPGLIAHPDCKARHFERNNYKGAAKQREGDWQRCVDCGRVTGERRFVWAEWRLERVKIERDHPVRIADYGPREWTVARCTRCHRTKTSAEQRRAARRGKGSAVTPPHSKSVRGSSSDGPSLLTRGAGVLLIAASAWWFLKDPETPTFRAPGQPRIPDATTLVLFTGAVFAVVGVVLWVRARHLARRRKVRNLRDVLAKATGSNPADRNLPLNIRHWHRGAPVSGRYTYFHLFDDSDGSPDRARVEHLLRGKVGRPLTVIWDPPHNTVKWEPRAAADDDPERPVIDRHPEIKRRVEEAVQGTINGDVTVTWGNGDGDGPLAFTIDYPSTYNDESDEVRSTLARRVNAKAPGRWAARWNTESNQVRFQKRPTMPSMIANPVVSDNSDTWRIPVGPDEDHDEVSWDLKEAPHALVVGPTGKGKSVFLRSVIVDATVLGFIVFGIDPKRVELTGLREWPGVRAIASSVPEMVALLTMLADEMDARYEAIEGGYESEDTLAPVLIVIDEISEFIQRVNAAWKADGGRGTEHPVVERWRSMSRLGRSARMHLVVGTQRPDAKVLGGEARDNYGFRIALGAMSAEGARMMFGRVDVARDIPPSAKGRATVAVGADRVVEVQTYYTPNPMKADALEKVHLSELAEAANQQAAQGLADINPDTVAAFARRYNGDNGDAPRSTTRTRRKPPARVKVVRDWEPVTVTRLGDRDRIKVEENGSPVEVTMVGAATETSEDSDEFEVSYRRDDGSQDCVVVEGAAYFDRKVAPGTKPGVR
jgi:hypothetical protein